MNRAAFEPDFMVAVQPGEAGPVIRVRGELDSGTCDELLDAYTSAIGTVETGEITLDLSAVTFIDSAGTRTVIMLEREARDRGLSLAILAPPDDVTDLLRTAGIIERFQLRPAGTDATVRASSPLERVELELPRAPGSPARARAEVRELLARREDTQVADVVLLISEIVTNAVEHPPASAVAELAVRILTYPEGIRVEVDDGGDGFDPSVPSEPRAERGRGLFLVDRFSSRWGTDHVSDGRGRRFRVWFELDWQQAAEGQA